VCNRLAAGLRRARSVWPGSAAKQSRAPRELNELNGKMSANAKRDPGGWLARELQFALNYECYETAERLARFAQSTWPQFPRGAQRLLVAPIAEAFIAVGAKDEALTLLNAHRHAFRNDDRVAGLFAVLANAAEPQPALLPSGKLNAFALSRSAGAHRDELQRLYETRPRLFEQYPQNYLLLCNAALGNSETRYREGMNKFLGKHGAGEVALVNFSQNILDDIEFRPGPVISDGPRVSVIMSAYNSASTIGYAVKSILAQQYRNIELLVCDDVSKDATMDAILGAASGDERVRIFRSCRNQGPYNIRNALLHVATGDYVTFQDADDFALPSRIGLQVQKLMASKTSAIVGRWIRMRPSGEIVFFRDRSALRNCLVSIMSAKSTFLRYGPYRPVRFGGDTQFKERIRLAEGDAAILQLADPLIFGLWSAHSLTQSNGSESLEDGYRGLKRRRMAEITTRQRLLGEALVPESEVMQALTDEQIIVEPGGIEIVDRN
jgi:hypothetical protein